MKGDGNTVYFIVLSKYEGITFSSIFISESVIKYIVQSVSRIPWINYSYSCY